MTKLTAAQKRFFKNATLNIAAQLIFRKLEESKFPKKNLGDVCTVCRGGSPRPKGDPKYFGGSIPWIMISDASNSPGKYIYSTSETVTEEGAKKSRLLKAGTLVVTNSATIGLPKILGVDGCIHDGFLAFLDLSQDIERDFLYYFFIYTRTYLEKIAPETTQKNLNTNIANFLKLPIPDTDLQKAIYTFLEVVESRQQGFTKNRLPNLPFPLSDVKRIVARVEELVGKVEEVRSLRQKALKETDILLTRAITTILDNDEWEELPLNKLLRENSLNGLSPRPSETPPGLPILRISAATSKADAIIDEADFKYLEVSEQDAVKYKLEPGDLLACRYNGNLHYTGKFALYKAYSGKEHLYPDKLIRFRVDTNNIMPEFARLALNSAKCRKIIESFCATTAGNIGLSAGNLKTVPVPVPPLLEQRRIVAYFEELQTKVDTMKRLREQAMRELDALLPSILDKAFKGEL
ncbi:restriction endonuclease subunit S [Nostoc sp. WHI]|uniref:restriction endonuclease subunit S n=1 Tax=Nostoc sp. WHI TaxID=2650611 RepID=UPI0018C7C048|nr:restriction endonuclease subunit S [Nostoc sp. WHI]MBG1270863.1 hypothetical protein [Nostoc sp. WHI]